MNRLRELREKQGLTQSDMAEKIGKSRTTYTKWEAGMHEPDFETVKSLADYFGVTVDYILGRTASPDPELLTIPEELESVHVAFHRGEFEGLTQDEVDALAIIAKTLKAQRLGDTKDDKAGSTL